MYLYWRINNDLNTMGESMVFNDPRFIRCFRQWVQKNALALARCENVFEDAFFVSQN